MTIKPPLSELFDSLSPKDQKEVTEYVVELAEAQKVSKLKRVARFLIREVLALLNDAVILAVGMVAGERVLRFAYQMPMVDLTAPAYWQWFFITWLALLLILNYTGYATRLVIALLKRFVKMFLPTGEAPKP